MLDVFRLEAYTGVNRCYPCTLANVVILLGTCAIVALLSGFWAIVLGVIGLATISLRGYLVPFTPQITGHLKQAWVKRISQPGKSQTDPNSLSDEEFSGEQILTEFLETGILVAVDEDDLELSPSFKDSWQSLLNDVPTESIRDFEDWANENVETRDIRDIEAVAQPWVDPYIVVRFDSGEEITLRYPIAIAELSALKVLMTENLSENVCLNGVGTLRAFLERCPRCNSPLEQSNYSGCCGNPKAGDEALGLVCTTCQDIYFKFP